MFPIVAATVYCPAKGPAFPNAKELSESLLSPITSELVCGRAGPRVILGDFNCEPGALDQMRIWKSLGWVELQDFFSQTHDVVPRPTCKMTTRPDQVWLSPEVLPMLCNLALRRVFPDHDMVIAGLAVPCQSPSTLQWALPGHIPWGHWLRRIGFVLLIQHLLFRWIFPLLVTGMRCRRKTRARLLAHRLSKIGVPDSNRLRPNACHLTQFVGIVASTEGVLSLRQNTDLVMPLRHGQADQGKCHKAAVS